MSELATLMIVFGIVCLRVIYARRLWLERRGPTKRPVWFVGASTSMHKMNRDDSWHLHQ